MHLCRSRRRLSDREAHAFISVLYHEAGWRDSKPSVTFWGVTRKRAPLVREEAERLAEALRTRQCKS